MSSSTKREVSHDPKEIEQRQRRSSRLIRKLLGSRSKKSSTSTEDKMSKIINQLHLQNRLFWKQTNNSHFPNQYARVKNVEIEEDTIKEYTDQSFAFVDEFLEEEMKSSSLYEADEDIDFVYWSSNHNAHATLSISNSLHKKCMNLLHLPEKYDISILDGGADTCVLGQGWEVLSVHNSRRANVVGFDHEAAVKGIFQ
jgi:hypothetical protein